MHKKNEPINSSILAMYHVNYVKKI